MTNISLEYFVFFFLTNWACNKEILKIMRKNSDINSFYYFNEVLDFNWLGVRMMC